MVVIEVNEADVEKVFEILINNGRFSQLSPTQFRIDENSEQTLDKIKQADIEVQVVNNVAAE